MSKARDVEKVKLIAKAAGLQAQHITPLGRGATSAAWRLATLHDAFIVRFMPAGTQRPVTYQSEFTILRMLRQAGCPVPEPIMSSVELAVPLSELPEPWAVTRTLPGEAIHTHPLTLDVAQDLGLVLARLHEFPVQGYGRLVERPHVLIGQQQNPVAGVCARWCWADLWPFDESALQHHPFTQVTPHLQKDMEAVETPIWASVEETPVVLTHSDLHGKHVFVCNETLSGVIDFGAAFIGVPAWDFAVLAFYHGWPAVQATLNGYGASWKNEKFLRHIQLLALVVGLYKLSRAVKAQEPATKIERIIQFLSRALEELH